MNNKNTISYIVVVAVCALFSIAPVAFGAAFQNTNPGGDQTPSAGTNFEVGEAVWVNDVFTARSRAGGTGTLRAFQLTTGANTGIYINTGGSVGIGTTVPGVTLDVNGNILARGGNFMFSNASTSNREYISSFDEGITGLNTRGMFGFFADDSLGANVTSPTAGVSVAGIYSSSNVGIGSASPAYTLDVFGSGQFTQPVIVGTPVASNQATTKSYVDSMFTGSGQWTTSGSNAYFSLAGNVGIGTTNPLGKFQVESSGGANTGIRLNLSSGASYAPIDFYTPTGLAGQFLATGATFTNGGFKGDELILASELPAGGLHLGAIGASGYIKFTTGGLAEANERMRINAAGNVGIGTTNPTNPLQVQVGAAGRAFRVYSVSDYPAISGTSGDLFIGATQFMGTVTPWSDLSITLGSSGRRWSNFYSQQITDNGANVGIGSTTPGYKLDVAGTGSFTQPVIVGTPTGSTHATTKSYVDSAVSSGVTGGITGTTNYISKFTGTNTIGNSQIFDNGTNVGIGTTSPATRLHVDSGTVSRLALILQQSVNTSYPQIQCRNNAGAATLCEITSGVFNNGGTFYNQDALVQRGIIFNDSAAYLQINGGTSGHTYFNGNVGISSSAPAYTLDVSGSGQFTQPVIVGTPIAANQATTKSYVDSIISTGYLPLTGGTMVGNINMNGNNISAVNKLTVTTIDPLYEIEGSKYSTYASAIAGGVREEYVGRGMLIPRKSQVPNNKCQTNTKNQNNRNNLENSDFEDYLKIENCDLEFGGTAYEYTIDFNKVTKGSDLWVWRKTVDFSRKNVEVMATAYGVPVPIAYKIEDNKVIFNSEIPDTKYSISDAGFEFSYRLVGKRIDWKKWPTYASDQSEKASIIIR